MSPIARGEFLVQLANLLKPIASPRLMADPTGPKVSSVSVITQPCAAGSGQPAAAPDLCLDVELEDGTVFRIFVSEAPDRSKEP
jgi:hypothetical protein